MKLRILFVLALGFLLIQSADAQNRSDRNLIAAAKKVTGDSFPFFSETSKGARVYSVNQPSTKMLNAIDTGLSDLFKIAKKHNYTNRLNYSDYTIFIAKPDRTKDASGQYSPDIAVSAYQYAGSVYDQGGFVYAAGMVLSNNPCAFVFAEHTKDLQRVSNIVRYEGEHLVLYHNDRRKYRETADHSQGGGHPILE